MKARILLVEYNEALSEGLRKVFEDVGYEVAIYTSYEEAIRIIPEARPDFVWVHVRSGEIQDPIQSGLEVIRCDKQWNPKLPIMVTTAGPQNCLLKARELGATHGCHIPFEPDDILSIIERAVQRETEL